MWGIASVHVGDSISTVAQAIQYCRGRAAVLQGIHQYMWGIASVLWRLFSTAGDSISTVEAIQYCGGIASVYVGDSISTVGDSISTVEK